MWSQTGVIIMRWRENEGLRAAYDFIISSIEDIAQNTEFITMLYHHMKSPPHFFKDEVKGSIKMPDWGIR